MISTRHKGLYLAGQTHEHWRNRIPSELPGQIWCSGAGSTDLLFPDLNPNAEGVLDLNGTFTDIGFPILSFDTMFTWGNDAAISRLDALYAYATGTLGWDDKVILLAGSQGGATSTNWAVRNPDKVRAIVLLVPLTHLKDFHDQNRGGFAASIETAYGGLSAFNAAVPTHDPIQFAADLADIPMRGWYSTNDPLIHFDETKEFMDIVGADLLSLGPVGHDITSLDPGDVLDFLEPYA